MSTVRAADEFLRGNQSYQGMFLDGNVLHQVVEDYQRWLEQKEADLRREAALAFKAVRDNFNERIAPYVQNEEIF